MADWSVELFTPDGAIPEATLNRLQAAALHVLRAENARDCEISIALVDDEAMTALNRDYLGHDRTTDVIAFPLEQPGTFLFGDVYIGYEQARRQAEELGIDPEEELLRLAVHGTLHVLGWDHPEEEREGSAMYRRQEELVSVVVAGG
jgi:probable rRNA maturation factor